MLVAQVLYSVLSILGSCILTWLITGTCVNVIVKVS